MKEQKVECVPEMYGGKGHGILKDILGERNSMGNEACMPRPRWN